MKYYSLVFCIIFYVQNINAQAKFSVVASGKKISKNEYVQIQYIMENASSVTEIVPPNFKNFSVISGPEQQSGMSNINGSISQYVSVSFVLKPLQTGLLTISSASAKADGKKFTSDPVKVEVTNSTSSNNGSASNSPSSFGNFFSEIPLQPEVHEYDDYILRKGENLQDKIRKNLFVKVEVSKASCYVGEPVVATYKLFTRLRSESNLVKSPAFNGFSVNDLEKPDGYTMHTEKLNGREYNVYLLRKVQLYPLQAGSIELDPAEVENKITFIKAEYADARKGDMFYDMLHDFANASTPQGNVEQTITLQSQPDSIVVKPLPVEGKPEQFKGAVGDFKIEVVADKNNITTDDADNLKLTISGAGNIQMINPPAINWPAGIEGFEARLTEKIDNTSVPMTGSKVFNYPFTVSRALNYFIPSVSFSYFDINTKTYKTITSKTVEINVIKGKGNIKRTTANADDDTESGNVTDILYDNLLPVSTSIIVLGFLIFLFIKYSRKKRPEPKTKLSPVIEESPVENVISIPPDPLLKTREQLELDNPKLFYSYLDEALKKYLSLKLNFPVEDFSRGKITELLDKNNVNIRTRLMISSLLENIELNLYAPFSSSYQMEEIYNKASEIVVELDKEILYPSVNL